MQLYVLKENKISHQYFIRFNIALQATDPKFAAYLCLRMVCVAYQVVPFLYDYFQRTSFNSINFVILISDCLKFPLGSENGVVKVWDLSAPLESLDGDSDDFFSGKLTDSLPGRDNSESCSNFCKC